MATERRREGGREGELGRKEARVRCSAGVRIGEEEEEEEEREDEEVEKEVSQAWRARRKTATS